MILFLFFILLHASSSSKDIIARIREQHEIVNLPTSHLILHLTEQQKQYYTPEAEKQLKKLTSSYETQMSRALGHFLSTTEVSEYTSDRTTKLALLLIRQDDELLGLMLPDERDTLLLHIKQFHASSWPENRDLLIQIIQEARSADAMRQSIRRLPLLSDKQTIHTVLKRVDALYGRENIPLRRHIRRYLKTGNHLSKVIDLWKEYCSYNKLFVL